MGPLIVYCTGLAGFEGGGASVRHEQGMPACRSIPQPWRTRAQPEVERAVCATEFGCRKRESKLHQPGGLCTGARRQRRKSRYQLHTIRDPEWGPLLYVVRILAGVKYIYDLYDLTSLSSGGRASEKARYNASLRERICASSTLSFQSAVKIPLTSVSTSESCV